MIDLRLGDCLDVLATLPDSSVDAVITDPPYAEVARSYGRWSEADWHTLMHAVVREVRRVLTPEGSAMFLVQPNSEHVGQMRPWVWDFMAWCCRDWNVVQDAYWWNISAPPTVHTHRTIGLMRPSLKYCIWLGDPACYRDQAGVLWTETQRNAAMRQEGRALQHRPSGWTMRNARCGDAALERGGVTPFNILPLSNGNSTSSGGAFGHGAATPLELCRWWVRYIVRPGGTVLDPFSGTATVGIAAVQEGRSYIGIERDPGYHEIAAARLADTQRPLTA